MTTERLLIEDRCEAAAKAQYEHLLGQVWEEETLENRAQWIIAMRTALDAADATMLSRSSLSLTAELLGGLKFPDKEWADLTDESKNRLHSVAQTITEGTQGRF